MKRSMVALLYFCVLSLFSFVSRADDVLHIFTWEDYLDPEVVAEFEKTHHIKLKFSYFQNEEKRDRIMATRNGQGFDLILMDGLTAEAYIKLGWAAPLTENEVPNLKYNNNLWRSHQPALAGYVAPYAWGTQGVAYRSDLVRPISRFMQLFRPADELKGKIVMTPQATEMLPIALQTLGYDMYDESPQALTLAAELIAAQRPHVLTYRSLKTNGESLLVTGEAVAAVAYSGDALMLKQLNPNIEYRLPEEGGIVWFDYFIVSRYASDPEAAYAFLNFISEPRNAARNCEFTYSATYNEEALKILPEELLANQTVFPAINPRMGTHKAPSTLYKRRMMSIWHNLGFEQILQ
ncbi:extracellular solute-binding protein [Hahella sp. KA22]|nr:spermidine/putrescine ABC transporter substrate-binding protein [Hahella sp. KA22]QAY56890.1 extracellular solute-binding protein [Hahella sp. KA22]